LHLPADVCQCITLAVTISPPFPHHHHPPALSILIADLLEEKDRTWTVNFSFQTLIEQCRLFICKLPTSR